MEQTRDGISRGYGTQVPGIFEINDAAGATESIADEMESSGNAPSMPPGGGCRAVDFFLAPPRLPGIVSEANSDISVGTMLRFLTRLLAVLLEYNVLKRLPFFAAFLDALVFSSTLSASVVENIPEKVVCRLLPPPSALRFAKRLARAARRSKGRKVVHCTPRKANWRFLVSKKERKQG